MAKKKELDPSIEEIKKNLDSDKIILGTEKTLKNLKLGRVEKVFTTSNCPENIIEDIEYYSKLSGAEMVKLDYPNDELGTVCKKPFSISIVSLLKV